MTKSYLPITQLPSDWQSLQDQRLVTMADAWKQQQTELQETDALAEFMTRLRREWAIETGVIERLYAISDSATKTLIEGGIDASLLTSADTDKPPSEVIAMIRDQEDAIEGIYEFIARSRSISAVFVRQLHETLTRHQSSCEAVDSLGMVRQVQLERGVWKSLPNNLGDGAAAVFAPPHLVETEMDNLLRWTNEYLEQQVAPHVLAAWLHHRFTLIHPFQDGNGRMARCLASIVMIRAGWFPLVVTRNDKVTYIEALRSADRGDLQPLVACFAQLQRKAVYKAMSLSAQTLHDTRQRQDILGGVRATLSKIRDQKLADESRVYETAIALHDLAARRLKELVDALRPTLNEFDLGYSCTSLRGDRHSEQAEWNKGQVVEVAKRIGYFADMMSFRCWTLLRIDSGRRFELHFDFHGLGKRRALGQTLCCSAIFVEKGQDGEILRAVPMSDDLFELTDRDKFEQVTGAFRQWLEQTVRSGLTLWEQALL